MSLVGTRPILPDELEQYELHHRARIAIKPGITGMWQVSGRSDITDFEEIVRLDTEYISEWNIGLDIKILFKTVLAVLNHNCSITCINKVKIGSHCKFGNNLVIVDHDHNFKHQTNDEYVSDPIQIGNNVSIVL